MAENRNSWDRPSKFQRKHTADKPQMFSFSGLGRASSKVEEQGAGGGPKLSVVEENVLRHYHRPNGPHSGARAAI